MKFVLFSLLSNLQNPVTGETFSAQKKLQSIIGKFLEQKGITATWFAKKTGLSRNTINKLLNETDDYSPKLSTIKKIMKVIKEKSIQTKTAVIFLTCKKCRSITDGTLFNHLVFSFSHRSLFLN